MESMTIVLAFIGFFTPVLTAIGLFMIKGLIDLNKRVGNLEGKHSILDNEPHDLMDK